MYVVSFNNVSRVRPSVNRDFQRIYGCVARSAIVAKYTRAAAVKPKNRPGSARPGHVNITPVITAVDFGQFSLSNTGTSFLQRDAMHKRDLCCRVVSVCLSVCMSRS